MILPPLRKTAKQLTNQESAAEINAIISALSAFSRVFSVREYGALGDGVADDLPAFRLAYAAVKAAGGGTIFIPAGTYAFLSSTNTAGIVWQWAIESDNVRIEWEPGAKIVSTVANARVLMIYGSAKPAGMANWNTNEYRDATSYALTGNKAKGSRVVTCAVAGDAANFAQNDLVYIRTGQTVSTGTDTEPSSEISLVRGVSGADVILSWPLAHAYSQENYNAGATGLTSPSGAGSAAPYRISKVADRTLLNIELVNPTIEGSGYLQAISVWGVVGFRMTGGNIRTSKNGLGARDVRYADCSGFRVYRDDDGTRAYLFGPSTGCTDWDAYGFELEADGDGYLHIHEDVAASRFHHFTVANGNHDGLDPLIDVRSRATDVEISHWTLRVQAAAEANVVVVGAELPATGLLSDGQIVAGNAACNVRIDAPGFLVQNVWTNNGRVGLRGLQVNSGHQTETLVYSCVIDKDHPFVSMDRALPRHAVVLRAWVYVSVAFDSSGTDLVSLGHASNPTLYATGIDVSTTGFKTVTLTAVPEHTNNRFLSALYVPGGSAPTTGSADVYFECMRLARRD